MGKFISIQNQLGKFNELTKSKQFIALYKLKTNLILKSKHLFNPKIDLN